jgi:hypothetical protein
MDNNNRQIVLFFGQHQIQQFRPIPVGLFFFYGEFDPGSGRTLAACLTHASRTMNWSLLQGLVANG